MLMNKESSVKINTNSPWKKIVFSHAFYAILLGLLTVSISIFIAPSPITEYKSATTQQITKDVTHDIQSNVTQSPISSSDNETNKPQNTKTATCEHLTAYHLKDFFSKLFETLGIALIGFGTFGILMDTRSWREYFADRLRDIVMNDEYLLKLGPAALKDLEVKVLKTIYHDNTIDREGGFLNYLQTSILNYTSTPYREDVSAQLEIEDQATYLMITDTITYTCRKSGKYIQQNVAWLPDEGEFEEFYKILITVKYPYNHDKKGESCTLFDSTKKWPGTTDILQEITANPIDIPLTDYKDIDQLNVSVHTKYRISKNRFQYWQMTHPTKNFTLYISHPKNFKIQFKHLALDPKIVDTVIGTHFASMKCDSWMLPWAGLAWRFEQSGSN